VTLFPEDGNVTFRSGKFSFPPSDLAPPPFLLLKKGVDFPPGSGATQALPFFPSSRSFPVTSPDTWGRRPFDRDAGFLERRPFFLSPFFFSFPLISTLSLFLLDKSYCLVGWFLEPPLSVSCWRRFSLSEARTPSARLLYASSFSRPVSVTSSVRSARSPLFANYSLIDSFAPKRDGFLFTFRVLLIADRAGPLGDTWNPLSNELKSCFLARPLPPFFSRNITW